MYSIILEIALLWLIFYMMLVLIKGTVAEQVVKGFVVISLVAVLSKTLNLNIINWIITRALGIAVISIIVIFQPEIRRGLARLGRFGVFTGESQVLEESAKAAVVLSKRKVGGLIAIEREVGLRRYIESGVEIDAVVTTELINTIFSPTTALHDGGIIVARQRIEAAACLFPLTQNPHIPKTMGTRHRAALGLSEETDAVVVVVSEETGDISIAVEGKMTRNIEHKNVVKLIGGIMSKNINNPVTSALKNIFSKSEAA